MRSYAMVVFGFIFLSCGCKSSVPQGKRPYSPSTTFEYSVPRLEKVTITVNDTSGSQLMVLISEEKGPGTYYIVPDLKALQSGVYFFRFSSPDTSYVKRFVLLK